MNCKPGDLAFLRGLTNFSQYNGRVVKVIAWLADRGMREVECQFTLDDFLRSFDRFGCRDENLLPISGVPVSDDVTDEVTA